MKIPIFLFFVSFVILTGLFRCASISPPSGGPMDTIPPILVRSVPENKSLNYSGNTIRLVYDEYLKIDNLNKQLIITPLIEEEYDSKIRKNSIELTFPEPFKDSTTYTFNFQEAIQDITENNVTYDNVLAFSTGNYIDSMAISGRVRELHTNEPVEDYTVCLYDAEDTTDIFNSKPIYLTRTNEDGLYNIENIKNGYYRMYVYNDLNTNLICDVPREKFGFYGDTLDLTHDHDSVMLYTYYLDLRPPEIRRVGPAGKYYEIRLNKTIEDYQVKLADTTREVYHNFGEENNIIRFYNTYRQMDSLLFYFHATDSLQQETSDTLYLKFTDSKRNKIDFTFSFQPRDKENIMDNFSGQFKFNKPAQFIPKDSMYFKYDSLTYQFIPPDSIYPSNQLKDNFLFHMELFFSEYIKNLEESDTVALPEQKNRLAGRQTASPSRKTPQMIKMHFDKGSFVSVENDTLPVINYQYALLNPENYGTIRGRVKSDKNSYRIQLLDKQGLKVQQEIENKSVYEFKNVKPGDYRIRVYIDENNNGRWDPGNIRELIEPEEVYFLGEVITVRANWEITDIDLTF